MINKNTIFVSMAVKNNTPGRKATTTTGSGLSIPEGLRKRIQADFLDLSKRIRAFGAKHQLPAEITTAIVADVKDFVFNDYQGLNLKVADVTYLGYFTHQEEWDQEVGDDFALKSVFGDYGRINTLIRLASIRDYYQHPGLQALMQDTLDRKLKTSSPLHIYEWARYSVNYDPDFANDDLLLKAQVYRYIDFLVYAGVKHQANAAELQQVQLPDLVERYLPSDEVRKIIDEVIGGILSVDLQLEHILGLHEHLGIKDQEGDQEDPAQASTEDQGAATEAPAEIPAEAAAKIAASTAETFNRRILKLYQPNTATLSRPIEAKKPDVMDAEVVAIRNLNGFKTARPLPLAQIITALADRVQISPARVTQTLQALQVIAQDKPDKVVDIGDSNEYYVYGQRSLKSIARVVLANDNPSGPDMLEVLRALELITTLRIGHDEDHVIGYSKKTGQPKIKRYRHYTQLLVLPDIRVELDRDNQEKDPHITLQIHRLIPTGRRSDRVVVEDGQKQRIAQPTQHLVTLDDYDLARKLFKGEAGVRFYNYLLSAAHKREPDFIAEVFDYDGQRAAAKQKADTLLEEARKSAAKASTTEEAANITQEAQEAAKAILKAVEDGLRKHGPRDRQRLYTWLNDAVDNFLIMPYSVTNAKDGSTDGRGKPIKVISWRTFKRDN